MSVDPPRLLARPMLGGTISLSRSAGDRATTSTRRLCPSRRTRPRGLGQQVTEQRLPRRASSTRRIRIRLATGLGQQVTEQRLPRGLTPLETLGEHLSRSAGDRATTSTSFAKAFGQQAAASRSAGDRATSKRLPPRATQRRSRADGAVSVSRWPSNDFHGTVVVDRRSAP
jgi:hypothetical protein